MRKLVITGSTAVICAALGISAYAAGDNGNASSGANSSSRTASQSQPQTQNGGATASSADQQQQKQAPEGWVLMEDRIVYLFANEPQQHLMHARDLLNQHNPKAAAAEVRIAAGYLDMQASRNGAQQASQQLRQESDQLRQFADRMASNDKTATPKQLDKQFAHAYVALADFQTQMADKELQSKKAIRAGHDLDAATSNLTQAVALAGQQPDSSVQKALSDCGQLASQLLNPAPSANTSTASNASKNQSNSSADQAQHAGYSSSSNSSAQSEDLDQTSNNIPSNASTDCQELQKAIQTVQSQVGKSSQPTGSSASSANTNSHHS